MARQNGKTTIVKPLITKALRAGLRILHIADKLEPAARDAQHDRQRAVQGTRAVPQAAWQDDLAALRHRARKRSSWLTAGCYRIASKTGGRGWAEVDILIIDELREMEDFEVIGAASSTQAVSPDPLTIYLSNAGSDKSVVLNSVRARAGNDPQPGLPRMVG